MAYLIEGKKAKWEVVIGLEVHCQIISKSKLFSGSSASFGGEPNNNVSFIDAGMPGVLPQLNIFCMEQAIKTGLALNGTINKVSYFDRKHYFYPDNPFGYQITQFYKPIMENGFANIPIENGKTKRIGINRLHVEQDAGKLLHEHHANKSFVDLNRAGVGLMEIVTEPDLRSKEEVASYVNYLRTLVRYLGTCDGNMEEGSMRCDINISVRQPGESFRTRVEVKNVNSIKFIQQAIDFEVKQQIQTWESGNEVFQETKLFDSKSGQTYSLRSKEDAGDYRYVRDPDLLPLSLSEEFINNIKENLPELPHVKRDRFINEYGLSEYDADLLTSDKAYANYFEEVIGFTTSKKNPKLVANWITTNVFSFLNKEGITISESKVSPQLMAELIDLTVNGTISGKIAKDVFDDMWVSQRSPSLIVEEKGLTQISDISVIENLVNNLVLNNQDKVAEIKNGKDKLKGWFVGQVMKESQGKANPEIVNKLLDKKILE